jgi:hypothetical protein
MTSVVDWAEAGAARIKPAARAIRKARIAPP